MRRIRYTKYVPDPAGEMSMEDLLSALSDYLLQSGFQNYMNFWVYARPEVTSVADLRGKKVGTTRIGSGAHLGVLEMLRANNLQPDRDVAVLDESGADAPRAEALGEEDLLQLHGARSIREPGRCAPRVLAAP